ncbi:MAG: hypothetical protein FJ125_09005 [Deltaproteobacteria bacterium]|nr:hypothetical protein [Deltaproteobacteria bacterium]
MSSARLTLLLGVGAILGTGCMSVGTNLGPRTVPASMIRAADQELLAQAVDSAFDKLKLPSFESLRLVSEPPGGVGEPGPPALPRPYVRGYVHVASLTEIPDTLRDYIGAKAAAAAASAGIGVLEVRRAFEKRSDGEWSLLYEEYPDADVRVLVQVSYVGLDEARESIPARHSDHRETVLKGRFKATLTVVPRLARVEPFQQVVSGESRFEINDGKYLDARP